MFHEFLPGAKNRLLSILHRREENARRRKMGMSSVAENTADVVERLKEKFPDDEWIQSAEDMVEYDRQLDIAANQMDRMSEQASNN